MTAIVITELQLAIVLTIRQAKRPLGPTEIGLDLKDEIEHAPGNVGKALKALVQGGVVTREEINKRRVLYGLPDFESLPAFELPPPTAAGRKPSAKRDLKNYIAKYMKPQWGPMSVQNIAQTRTQAFSWRQSTKFQHFAVTRLSQARPDMSKFGEHQRMAVEVDNLMLYGFASKGDRDAFIAETGGEMID